MNIKACIFDLDGVIYRGNTLISGAKECISKLQEKKIPFIFLTNNSSKTAEAIAGKLKNLGLENINTKQILSSAIACGLWLNKNIDKSARIFIFGMEGIQTEVEKYGFKITDQADADYVVAGLNSYISYEQLSNATLALKNGAKLIATNMDRTFPTEKGLTPGAGSLMQPLIYAADIEPVIVLGKPSKDIFELALDKLAYRAQDVLMLGDRLDTDILGAKNAGLQSALLLTGVNSKADCDLQNIYPDFIFQDLTDCQFFDRDEQSQNKILQDQ